jgi:N-acetylglucosamine kinase-like BadF-type ATPase
MSTESYYLGVDGGGSKTLAVVVDADGHERGRGRAGSANYAAVGLEQAVQNIHTAVQQAAHEVPCSLPFTKAWLGLAGVDRSSDAALLGSRVRDLATFVSVTNDADLLLSALEGQAGSVLIVGTGSIALARDSTGHVSRVGGWGYILGDEGSGYDIGRRGLQAAVRAADGRGKATSLLLSIVRHWQLRSVEDFIDVVYTADNRAKIARVAPCVTLAARQGDSVASEIIEQAASELALLVRTIAPAMSRLPLALGGGLLLHDAFLRERVLHHIQQEQEIGPVVHVDHPALSAACSARTLSPREDKR